MLGIFKRQNQDPRPTKRDIERNLRSRGYSRKESKKLVSWMEEIDGRLFKPVDARQ